MAERWMVTPPMSKAFPVTTSICGKGMRCFASGRFSGFQLLMNRVGSL
jgi:hypothetical protein